MRCDALVYELEFVEAKGVSARSRTGALSRQEEAFAGRASGDMVSVTKKPPGRRCLAAFSKQSTCSSCVTRLMKVFQIA
jgi:hypothetical protein